MYLGKTFNLELIPCMFDKHFAKKEPTWNKLNLDVEKTLISEVCGALTRYS